LYGIAHSVITGLGCSPALGFVHSGDDRSFVFDVADLYRAEIAIPVAFQAAAQGDQAIRPRTRRLMRDQLFERKVMRRSVADIVRLLVPEGGQ
jgi:CRISPR-associated protein Cas1